MSPDQPTAAPGPNQTVSNSQNVIQIGSAGPVDITQMLQQRPRRERACPTAPPPPPHFTGRTEQLADLHARLRAEQTTVITAVQSAGGLGKTALAKKLAQEAAQDGFTAVLWADVTPNPVPAMLLSGWARYADPDFVLPDLPLDQVAAHIRALLTALIAEQCPGRALVVLDDVWESSVETARLLLQAAPADAVPLITTRQLVVTQKLRCGQPLTVPKLSPGEAEALLAKLAPAASEACRREAAAVLGGHPLALELAAASLNLALDDGERAALIARYRRGLAEGAPFADLDLGEEGAGIRKEDSLAVTFNESYTTLTDEGRRRFRALGALAPDAPFDLTLVRAAWNDPDDESARAALRDLRNRTLIETTAEADWFAQHPLLRAYARALLRQAGELDAAERRVCAAVTGIADAGFARPPEEWPALEPYLPQVQHVGDRLYDRAARLVDVEALAQPDVGARHGVPLPGEDAGAEGLAAASDFAAAVTRYVLSRPEIGEMGRRWLALGLACARALAQRRREGLFTAALGYWHNQRGDRQRALDYHAASLAISREQDDRAGEAATLNNMGLVYADLGEPRRALDLYEQALPITRAVGDRAGEAATLYNMSFLVEPPQAVELVRQARDLWRAVESPNAQLAEQRLAELLGQAGGGG